MRIAGLASGMDIDSIVKNLMTAERMPLDKLKQKKQILEWKRDDYRSLNTQLLSFRDKLTQLKLTPNYRARTVSSSNEGRVTATVTSGASQASYSISEVKQLATAATKVNAGKLSEMGNGDKVDPSMSLLSQEQAFGQKITWNKGVVEAKTINVKEANMKILPLEDITLTTDDLLNVKVNGKSYEIITSGEPKAGQVLLDGGNLKFGSELAKDSVVKLDYVVPSETEQYATFEIESHTSQGVISERIIIRQEDSLNSVIRKVNESSVGVTMFYDSFSDQVTLTRKETGDFNKDGAEITVRGQFIEDILRFKESTETGGQNAVFTINGLETQRNTNTFDMSGVTFTLKQTFAAVEGESVAITIGNDSNQVFENIKTFVNQYNELIADIGKKLNEEKHRSYKPLTDEEREELSEKQQEKWEEMAKSGLLKGDPILSSVLSAMRLDMSSTVETNGLFKQLASIGIKTTANYLEGGKLEIDEAKLKAALEQDPDSVENLFRGNGLGSDRGIIHKLYDTVDASMNKLRDKAGRATSTNQQFALGRELLSVDKGIDRFEDKMKIVESRYWRQFTAMEKAIQRANQQSMYLMQQFNNF